MLMYRMILATNLYLCKSENKVNYHKILFEKLYENNY